MRGDGDRNHLHVYAAHVCAHSGEGVYSPGDALRAVSATGRCVHVASYPPAAHGSLPSPFSLGGIGIGIGIGVWVVPQHYL